MRGRTQEEEVDDAPDGVVALEGDWEGQSSITLDLLKKCRVGSQPFRKGDHVHVSDAVGKCLRRIALARRMNASFPAAGIMDGMGITYAQGDAIHDYVRDKLVRAHPDKVWAIWSCPCNHTRIGPCLFTKRGRHTTCPKCEHEVDKYNEVSVFDDGLDLVGNPDLILYLAEYDAFMPVELKSMAANMFKELARPVPDHVIQVSFYWHLMRKERMRLVDAAAILYVNKEYSFKLPFKEFPVKQPLAAERLQPYIDELIVLKDARKIENPLPVRTCAAMDVAAAKNCHVCVACFEADRTK